MNAHRYCKSATFKLLLFSNGTTKIVLFDLNKAGYTAIPVACGLAGAVFEVT